MFVKMQLLIMQKLNKKQFKKNQRDNIKIDIDIQCFKKEDQVKMMIFFFRNSFQNKIKLNYGFILINPKYHILLNQIKQMQQIEILFFINHQSSLLKIAKHNKFYYFIQQFYMQFKKGSYYAKVLIIGDSGVGKTSIISASLQQDFKYTMPVTVGAQFKSKKMVIKDKNIVLKLQDTAGQQRYRSIANSYYKGSQAAFLVFDLTNEQSFKNIKHWMRQLKTLAGQNIIKIILGNKCDLSQQIKIKKEEIQAFCTQHELKYFQVSALTRQNIEESFLSIAQILIDGAPQIVEKSQNNSKNSKQNEVIKLDEQKKVEKTQKQKKCC